MEHLGRLFDNSNELVEETIDAEAKAGLQPPLCFASWICVAHGVIARLKPPWPSHWPKSRQLTTLETSPSEGLQLRASRYIPRT